MPQTNRNQVWNSSGVLISEEIVELTDAEVEISNTATLLRQVITLLESWADDTVTIEQVTAMTAAQRIQLQVQVTNRVATHSRILRRILRLMAIAE